MWDEKKFFEDYVEESEKVKPDEHFVQQLKQMAAQEEKKKTPIPMIKYVAIAASFVLCVGLGSAVWRNQSVDSEGKGEKVEFQTGLQAGKQESEEQKGETSENNTITEGEIRGNNTQEESELADVLAQIKQGAVIRDEDGNEVSQDQQQSLYELLKNVTEAEAPTEGEEQNSYIVEGDTTIEVEVWTDGYLKVGGKWYH